jgi:hypothetical protein
MDLFHTLTPFITLGLTVGMGAIGWFVRQLINDNRENFADLKKDLGTRIDKVESDIDRLEGKVEMDIKSIEAGRALDQKWVYENFIEKELYFRTIGEIKGLISKIFEEIKEVNRQVNQQIGANRKGSGNG